MATRRVKYEIDNIPDWMIIGAVRYCIGRMSYQVSVTTEWVVKNWHRLNEHVRTIIKQDVEEAFDRDDRYRVNSISYQPLGMDMDRKCWEQVRALWKEQE